MISIRPDASGIRSRTVGLFRIVIVWLIGPWRRLNPGRSSPAISCPCRMKALVTGGAGFIGSHLVDALVERGDPVVVVDNLSTGRRENLDGAIGEGAELVETDVTDAAAIADVVQKRRPEVVFHLAAQIDVRRSVADPVYDLGVNVGGTLNLLEAARLTTRGASCSPRPAGRSTGRGRDARSHSTSRPSAGRTPTTGRASTPRRATCRCTGAFTTSRGSPCAGQRLRGAAGPARRGRGGRHLLRSASGRRHRRGCSATGTRRATTCTSATSSRRSWPRPGRRPGHLQHRHRRRDERAQLGSLLARVCEREFDPEMAPARPGEVQRIAIDSARAAASWAGGPHRARGRSTRHGGLVSLVEQRWRLDRRPRYCSRRSRSSGPGGRRRTARSSAPCCSRARCSCAPPRWCSHGPPPGEPACGLAPGGDRARRAAALGVWAALSALWSPAPDVAIETAQRS